MSNHNNDIGELRLILGRHEEAIASLKSEVHELRKLVADVRAVIRAARFILLKTVAAVVYLRHIGGWLHRFFFNH